MDIQFVEQLIGLVENSRLAELEYSADGQRLRLRKHLAPGAAAALAPASVAAAAHAGAVPPPAAAAQHRILAGLGGTFFTRPAPGEQPFVKVGDTITDGQPLAIVEAMKMLNAVESDAVGTLVRICVKDGAAVSAGTELFVIEVG